MSNVLKKILGMFMVLTLVVSLAACGSDDQGEGNADSSGSGDTSDSGTDSSSDEEGDASGEATGEDVTLTLWSIATESDAFNPAFTKAIADFEEAHPGVKIVHETFENESYKTKIKTAIAANDLPDIFFTWGGGFSQAFVDSEKVMPLDAYYTEEYQSELPKAALGNAIYNDKLYGTTYSTPVSLMFYNKKMYDEYGLEAPTTFEELKEVSQTFLDNGITPFGISVKDTWVLAMMHDALTLKSAGPEKVKNVLTGVEGTYNDPDFVASASALKELVNMGALIDGATGLSNDEASQMFYSGQVPMYVTGSWMAGSIYTDSENPEDFDLAPIPVINDENAQITDFMGGASDTLMVAASTEYPDIAGNAAFELARSISKYAYLDGAGVAAWEVNYDDSDIKPLVQKVAAYANGATSFTLWFDTLMSAEDAGEYLALLQELYIGNLTPEEFAEAMANQLEE